MFSLKLIKYFFGFSLMVHPLFRSLAVAIHHLGILFSIAQRGRCVEIRVLHLLQYFKLLNEYNGAHFQTSLSSYIRNDRFIKTAS